MKNIFYNLSLVFLTVLTAGCTANFEKYNTNPHEPETVSSAGLLSKMFEVFAWAEQNPCQRYNTMWASFSGHVTETGNWALGVAFQYYNSDNNYNDSSWGLSFERIDNSLYQIETQTGKQGIFYAMARLTKIYAGQALLSLYGPIPYTQRMAGELKIPFDSEEVAWHALFSDLDEVISILSSASGVNIELQSVDQFYKGDCTKWLKFANTLKLRMAMRISGKEPVLAQTKAEEAVASGVMESTDDSCWDTTNSNMPNGYYIVDSWGEVRANACLTSCMNGYEDPRREKYFTQHRSGGYIGVRHGCAETMQPSNYTNYSRLYCATVPNGTAPMVVMYAAEAAFLRAEGALKGWNMEGTAKDFYEKGIRLSFEEFDVDNADSYINNSSLKPSSYTDASHPANNHAAMSDITIKWEENDETDKKLERVLTQKWIALFLDPLNGWSDFRRTGYPRIFQSTKSEDPTCDTSRGQRRLRFPQSEYQQNEENVTAAVSMLSSGDDTNGTDLWWAKKKDGSY